MSRDSGINDMEDMATTRTVRFTITSHSDDGPSTITLSETLIPSDDWPITESAVSSNTSLHTLTSIDARLVEASRREAMLKHKQNLAMDFSRWFQNSVDIFASTPTAEYYGFANAMYHEAQDRWKGRSKWQEKMWLPPTYQDYEPWLELVTDFTIKLAANTEKLSESLIHPEIKMKLMSMEDTSVLHKRYYARRRLYDSIKNSTPIVRSFRNEMVSKDGRYSPDGS